jgi:hypothetical protein
MRTPVLGAAAVSLSLLASFAGRAQAQTLAEPAVGGPAFGNAGQLAIAGDFSFRFEHVEKVNRLEIAPAVDYFLIPNVSFGGQVLITYAGTDDAHTTAFGVGPRVGVNLALAPQFSLWPRAGFFLTHVADTASAGNVDITHTANYFSLFLYAPFLWHPVPHFFIGLGPSLDGIVAGGDESAHKLTIGLLSTVGGWLD